MDDKPQQEFKIIARVIKQKGHCAAGHQVGDEVIFDGLTVQGQVCIHALYSFLPKVFAMRYDARSPGCKTPTSPLTPAPTPGTPSSLRFAGYERRRENVQAKSYTRPKATQIA
jgi:uncharacterized repeat protein (TIGR04076 family)